MWMLETMLVSSTLSQGLLTERILNLTSLAMELVLGVSHLYLSHPWASGLFLTFSAFDIPQPFG